MKSKVVCFLLTAVFSLMLFGTVGAYAGVEYVNGDPVYKASDENNLLGVAADFGIFADEVDVSTHAASNVACNSLQYQNLHPTAIGVIYAKEYKAGNSIGYNNMYSSFLDGFKELKVFVGNQYDLSQAGDGWTLKKGNSQLTINPDGGTKLSFEKEGSVPFIDIKKELNSLKTLGCTLKLQQDKGARFEKKNNDDNEKWIYCTEDYNVLNLAYTDLVYYNQYNNGMDSRPLHIDGIKNTDRQLVVNITGLENVKYVYLPQILFGKDSAENGAKFTSQIIWNFADYSGEIGIEREFGGTILAPSASVVMRSNPVGSVICKKFTSTGGQFHFVPNKVKKYSEVQISVESVDGTCCPSVPIKGVSVILYKKTGGKKYKAVGKAKMTGEDGFATWTIKEEGDYYIRAVQGQDFEDFVETPIKCYFKVEKDKDGILRISKKKNAAEGNGESTAFFYSGNEDEKNSAYFKLRYYSNSLYLAANEFGEDGSFTLVSDQYDFTVTNVGTGNTVTVAMAKGLVDDQGVAYNIKEAHIKEAGRYLVEMSKDGVLLDIKFVDVYLLPVGAYTFVEEEYEDLAYEYRNCLEANETNGNITANYIITKLSKKGQQAIQQLSGKRYFDEMTDGCLFFNFETSDIIS